MKYFKVLKYLAFFVVAGIVTQSCSSDAESISINSSPEVLILGGGDSHDFERWFQVEDSTIIAGTGANVRYTNDPESIASELSEIDIFYSNTNQPIQDSEYPNRLIDFVESGNGLLLVHASTWFIWDWPNYFRDLIGGGSSSHGPLGEFEVYVTDPDHPLTQNVPERFTIKDELYRFQPVEDGAEIHVLAVGIEPDTGDEYPVAWVVEHGEGKVVNITLGHDGDAHQHEAYIALLENSVNWLNQ